MAKEKLMYIAKSQLIKAVGEDFKAVLDSLVEEGLAISYEEVYAVKFSVEQATHVQAALEFYEVQGYLPLIITRKGK